MVFDTEPPWFTTDSKFFANGQNIGLTLNEYRSWRKPGVTILEVGTGTEATTLQKMLADGINVIGIEPGMNYFGGGDKYRGLRSNQLLSQIIAPLKAADAIKHPLMPAEGVNVIFAENANFAQYALSNADFFNQLYGLVRCLKTSDRHSYLTFESLERGFVFTTQGENPANIDLPKVLRDLNARWTSRTSKSGTPYIVINRIGFDGEDIADGLKMQITNNEVQ